MRTSFRSGGSSTLITRRVQTIKMKLTRSETNTASSSGRRRSKPYKPPSAKSRNLHEPHDQRSRAKDHAHLLLEGHRRMSGSTKRQKSKGMKKSSDWSRSGEQTMRAHSPLRYRRGHITSKAAVGIAMIP